MILQITSKLVGFYEEGLLPSMDPNRRWDNPTSRVLGVGGRGQMDGKLGRAPRRVSVGRLGLGALTKGSGDQKGLQVCFLILSFPFFLPLLISLPISHSVFSGYLYSSLFHVLLYLSLSLFLVISSFPALILPYLLAI